MIANEIKKNVRATIAQRLIGWLIDFGILMLINAVLKDGDQSLFTPILLSFSYYFILEAIFDRTIGKLIVGTIVIDSKVEVYDEKRAINSMFIRTLCRFIPLEAISILFNSEGKLWHDTLSGTVVIQKKTLSSHYFIDSSKKYVNNNVDESFANTK